MRPATTADADRLFEWVNRPDSLAGKLRTTGPIPYDAHRHWFDRRLADPACRIRIIERNGVPMGQLRLERRDEGYEVDIYVDAACRHEGLAQGALTRAIAELRTDEPSSVLIATVRTENRASRHLFERLGFHLEAIAPDHLIYRFPKDQE
ncbi:MAG: GNAT family N-acetyltransferase [Alphaproteobacteria bacterium]